MNNATLTLVPPSYPALESEVYECELPAPERTTIAAPASVELEVAAMFTEEGS